MVLLHGNKLQLFCIAITWACWIVVFQAASVLQFASEYIRETQCAWMCRHRYVPGKQNNNPLLNCKVVVLHADIIIEVYYHVVSI